MRLPHRFLRDVLTSFSELSHWLLKAFSQLSHRLLTGFSELSHRLLTGFPQVSHSSSQACDSFLKSFLKASQNLLTGFSRLSHRFLKCFSEASHSFLTGFLKTTWVHEGFQLHQNYLVCPPRAFGRTTYMFLENYKSTVIYSISHTTMSQRLCSG